MIGIDISDQTIKIVQLSAGRGRRLGCRYLHLLPPKVVVNGIVVDAAAMEREIAKALASCGAMYRKKDPVVASIPESQSFLRVIEIPKMNEDEIGEAVQWEIAQHIPFGLENVYIDWQLLAASDHPIQPNHQEIQVGAAQKKVVDALYGVLKKLRLDVAAFELESQAIVRSLVSQEWRLKEGLLIVDIGSSATNVIVYEHGASRFTASLACGVASLISSLSPEDTHTVLENLHALPADIVEKMRVVIIPGIQQLATDIRGIVDFTNTSNAKHEVTEIILTGGGSNLPGLDDAFQKHFDDVQIQRGNPWVNILTGSGATHPPMDLQESVRYTTALGLALRDSVPL
ncbi:MAG: hypothetical protein A3C02_04015 [Candidatus Andersenbacteria bacterium RIFCSPHIGHO2_02_FULL_45_11]|uniref:SHS2 domain-containing protein n=1 Tax=Candidatus Andersenbacteria bacterium RIFCSPHIGHO2_12_FULL_45_11 TaxID=1797281 RepID=A0A1G1WZF3_9BACT|nr:MAG: hypothetical protein A2805_00730 [Candidatus Andersenbacteria bacterium RIFCSPHIGHO2_01_FULL_46_36]OGY33084.1 MAG: hypothetical protein A3D99_01345 [Candidatus Andersenbacteria bacterium RIFCSPHIGHO2_12_FULL_45_11]OGY33395.1 MAG: hypothetical protein A3C02_04015 [Candidatus Andersenbacteria bacterium RIFCSPHIGHO2_02_FULL_45_11]